MVSNIPKNKKEKDINEKINNFFENKKNEIERIVNEIKNGEKINNIITSSFPPETKISDNNINAFLGFEKI